MGGDHAPSAPVGGALLALQELDAAHSIQLVGRESVVRAELDRQLAGDFGGLRDVVAARLSIVHAEFINTMSQKPLTRQLLPAEPVKSSELQDMWDYIYEPSAAELLEGFMARYIESQVYRGAVENVACEMASKMVAMKAATDNAGKFIEGLQLQYNKARQAAITREIAEIVGGAAALD